MAKVLVTEAYLQAIADAIRTKNGKSVRYRPGGRDGVRRLRC